MVDEPSKTRFVVKGPGGLQGMMNKFWIVAGVIFVAFLWLTSGTPLWWIGIPWLLLMAIGWVTTRHRMKYAYIELDDTGLSLSYPFPGYIRYDEISKVWRNESTVHFQFLYPISVYALPFARKRRTLQFEIENADTFVNMLSGHA